MRLTEISHSSHQNHSLIWKCRQEPYQCDGCKELGFGACYECASCNFHLHEDCANADSSTFHPFLKNCTLKFHSKAPQVGERYCDACGRDMLGFLYQCTHNKPHDLHPCCAKLPPTLSGNGVTLHLKNKPPSKCLHCGSTEIMQGFKGWCYVSSCGQYCYHVACVKKIALKSWKRDYFREDEGFIDICSLVSRNVDTNNQEIVKKSGGRSSKYISWLKKAKSIVMLIISAIVGDPTTLILTLAQEWLSN